jgi:hypothetical protein
MMSEENIKNEFAQKCSLFNSFKAFLFFCLIKDKKISNLSLLFDVFRLNFSLDKIKKSKYNLWEQYFTKGARNVVVTPLSKRLKN